MNFGLRRTEHTRRAPSGRSSGDRPPNEGRGGRAIDAHVDAADGGPAAFRYPSARPRRFSGGTPLHAVTAHRLRDPDHWHLVTYGLTEMHEKETADRHRSGWGAELTLRLPDTREPPLWGVDFLSSLAGYVWTTERPFDAGHHIDLRGPMRLDSTSPLTAAVVVEDPCLDELAGPFGAVRFLQVVGVHADELEACRAWSTDGVVGLLRARDPLLLTDLSRPSLLADPDGRAAIEEGSRADGSALTELTVGTLEVHSARLGRGVEIRLGAGAAAALGPALRRELIGAGARFMVRGEHHRVRFTVASQAGWGRRGDLVSIRVPLDEVDGLAGVFTGKTGWGRRPAWPGVRFHVVP